MTQPVTRTDIKRLIAALFISMTAFSVHSQSADKPEIFTNIPPIHDDYIQRRPKLEITPEQLQTIVTQHGLIGDRLVQDCFDSQVGHICLDEIVSFFGKEREDYIEFRVVKPKQVVREEEYPNRVTIYLTEGNKIEKVIRQ